MSIEEQIRRIAREELKPQLDEFDERLRRYLEGELDEIKRELAALSSRTEKLEEEMDKKLNLLVKLRKYTLDQLMSEYKRLTNIMRAEKEEQPENAGV